MAIGMMSGGYNFGRNAIGTKRGADDYTKFLDEVQQASNQKQITSGRGMTADETQGITEGFMAPYQKRKTAENIAIIQAQDEAAKAKEAEKNSSSGGLASMIGTIGGGIVGTYFGGPAGTSIGSSLGGMLGGMAGGKKAGQAPPSTAPATSNPVPSVTGDPSQEMDIEELMKLLQSQGGYR